MSKHDPSTLGLKEPHLSAGEAELLLKSHMETSWEMLCYVMLCCYYQHSLNEFSPLHTLHKAVVNVPLSLSLSHSLIL